jgi:hypothetical protein
VAESQHLLLVSTVIVAVGAFLLFWRDASHGRFYRFAWPVVLAIWAVGIVTCLRRAPEVLATKLCRQVSLRRTSALSEFLVAFSEQPTWRDCWELECRLWMAEYECKALAAKIAEAGFTRADHLKYLERKIATTVPDGPEARPIRCQSGHADQDEQIHSRLRIALDALATAATSAKLSAFAERVRNLGPLVGRPDFPPRQPQEPGDDPPGRAGT